MKTIPPGKIAAILLAAALGTGCSSSSISSSSSKMETKEAVQKALMQYLRTKQGLDLDKMEVEVGRLEFSAGNAEADVSFRVKGSPEQGMSMHYTLRRSRGPNGDAWAVEKGRSSSGHPPPSPGAGAGTTPGVLPPGHPATQ